MEEEVEVSLPCRKGDYDLMGPGEIKCKKLKIWNVSLQGCLLDGRAGGTGGRR